MGSYGSQSVASLGAMLEQDARMKKEQEEQQAQQYKMPDTQIVTVIMPVGILRKIVRDGILTPEEESQAMAAFRHALWDEA